MAGRHTRGKRLGALLLFGLWSACDAGEPGLNPVTISTDSSVVGALDAGVGLSPGGSSAANPTPGGSSSGGANAGGALPCNVQTIVTQHCGTCHGAVPQFGAPMPLVSLADFRALAPRGGQTVSADAIDRLSRTGTGVMPPPPQPALPAQQKSALLDWLRAGAPAGSACAPARPGDAGAPKDAQVMSPSVDAAAAEGDCEISFELRASNGQGGKFPIPQQDDHYECFYIKANVDPNSLATSLSPLLDETRSLHHWLLFAAPNEAEAPSGTHRQCNGIHPGAYLMAAWLPGTPGLVLPPDVGMEMPTGASPQFILENHYNNVARLQNASDNSGVKVCATKKPKAQHAAIHWLGSEIINLQPNTQGMAQGTCTPTSQQPIHIMGVIPHMHQLGRHVSMTVLRANGASEVLHEGNFAFEGQTFYPKDIVLQPGDRVQTRCEYLNTTTKLVTLGEQTSDEMCYMFTLAYPVGSMNTGGDLLNALTGQPVVQGPNRCMR
jgi:hypothetical protein